MIPERIVSWLPYRADEPTESAHRIRTGSNRGSKVSRFESVPGLVFVCTESARIPDPDSSSVVFVFVSFFFCCGVWGRACLIRMRLSSFPLSSVVCQLSVPPLQRHQQAWGVYYSGFNPIRWVRVHANFSEPGSICTQLKIRSVWKMNPESLNLDSVCMGP